MSKRKMQEAQQLIQAKRYDEARAILNKINHPTAQKWLKRLDEIAPATKTRRSGGGGVLGYVLTVLISAIVTSVLIAGLVLVTAPFRSPEASAVALGPTAEGTAEVTVEPTPSITGEVQATQTLNVRSGPGVNFSVIGNISPGDQVVVLGQDEDINWYNIRLEDGSDGWVSAQFLRVSGESAPVTVTATPEATEDPREVCTPEEAQAWWDTYVSLYNRANYAIIYRAAEAVDYAELIAAFREERRPFNEDETFPLCVTQVRDTLNIGFGYVNTGMRDHRDGNIDMALARFEEAEEAFAQAQQVLTEELGVQIISSDCGAEFWYTMSTAQIAQVFEYVDDLDPETATREDVQAEFFELQSIRRTLTPLYSPPCAERANESMLAMVDAYIEMYRALDARDNATRVQQQSIAQNARNAFRSELRRLRVPVAQ